MVRGVLINPVLYLAFESRCNAEIAFKQHICLCRNEDLLYPDENYLEVNDEEFDTNEELFSGFELIFERNDQSFLVGYNRFKENQPMHGYLKVLGNPVKSNY